MNIMLTRSVWKANSVNFSNQNFGLRVWSWIWTKLDK